MKQEDRELLLKDLSARLVYGVKFRFKYIDNFFHENYTTSTLISVLPPYRIIHSTLTGKEYLQIEEDEIKPYLFPLSSMTEEQKEEYRMVCELDTEILSKHPMDGSPFPALYNSQDWLNAHHFDYRGLIEKGLAIDATGKNIY